MMFGSNHGGRASVVASKSFAQAFPGGDLPRNLRATFWLGKYGQERKCADLPCFFTGLFSRDMAIEYDQLVDECYVRGAGLPSAITGVVLHTRIARSDSLSMTIA